MTTSLRHLLAAVLAIALTCGPAAAGPALLFDANGGMVFYAEDVDQVWHPASLTKLMTAYLTFKALKEGKLKPDQELMVDEHAFKMPPSRLGLKVGEKITADLALKAMVVKSANDMAVIISEAIGGTEPGFADMMNAQAKLLGMKNTHYANASGLPNDAQLTSARDLAILTEALIKDFPEQAYLYSMTSVKVGDKEVETHNTLLKTYDGADGMKTGFICDSGYNIVASATRDGHRLIAVVLGEQSSASRNVRAAAMLDYGFQNYIWKSMFNDTTIANVPAAPTDTTVAASVRKEVASCVEHHPRFKGKHKGVAAKGGKGGGKAEPVPPDPTLGTDGAEGPTPAAQPKVKLKPGATASAG